MSGPARTTLRPLVAIVRRETLAAFTAPGAWITLAAFAATLGAFLVAGSLRTGEVASLRPMLVAAAWAMIALVPAISMRSVADEFRQGTWETLFTAPVPPGSIVLGKWLACLAYLAVATLVPVVAGTIALETVADPDPGEIASGTLGLLLGGAAFLAVGLLASSLTSNLLLAYLLPLFLLATLAAGSRLLAAVLPPDLAAMALSLDPVRRVEDFVIGLVDTANVGHFTLLAAAGLLATTAVLGRVRDGGWSRGAATPARRALSRLVATAYLLGCLGLVVAGTALLSTPALRGQFDATKTRAYTLAPSTVEFLEELPPGSAWTVSILVDPDRVDAATLRRIDEVLARIREANGAVTVERLDPSGPEGGERYERLLERLVASHGPTVARWEPALDGALDGFAELRRFAADEAPPVREALAAIAADDPLRPQLEQVAAAFEQVAGQGEPFATAIRGLLSTDAAKPLPDWEGARSALVANDRYWADQLAALADLLRRWSVSPSVAGPVREWARGRADPFEEMAAERKNEQYALETLPPLRLGDVGRTVASGDAAIVTGPGGAVAIPTWQIFPYSGGAASGRATVGLDFGGRGEEAIVGAMRSLTLATPPMVVFVHAEERSLLSRSADRSDLVAAAELLRAARLEVREWTVAGGERPVPARGQTVVWIVLPPLARSGLQTSEREKLLIQVTRELAGSGQPVLLTVARSLLPIFGQPDPWTAVARQVGAEIDTGRVVLELAAIASDAVETRPWQVVERFASRHPIAAAAEGNATFLNHPVPVRPAGGTAGAVPLVAIEPASSRWLEDDWRKDGAGLREVPAAKRLDAPLSVAVAIETVDTPNAAPRRAVVVGSGGWLLSSVIDAGQSLGGSRYALAHPGNRELLLASVWWLAGEDRLVAGGLSGRDVPRVGEVSEATRIFWFLALVVALPALLVGTGAIVAARRRRDAA
jgi:ABC-2 type transport system permease protein